MKIGRRIKSSGIPCRRCLMRRNTHHRAVCKHDMMMAKIMRNSNSLMTCGRRKLVLTRLALLCGRRHHGESNSMPSVIFTAVAFLRMQCRSVHREKYIVGSDDVHRPSTPSRESSHREAALNAEILGIFSGIFIMARCIDNNFHWEGVTTGLSRGVMSKS